MKDKIVSLTENEAKMAEIALSDRVLLEKERLVTMKLDRLSKGANEQLISGCIDEVLANMQCLISVLEKLREE